MKKLIKDMDMKELGAFICFGPNQSVQRAVQENSCNYG
jgi:hypothetical protein